MKILSTILLSALAATSAMAGGDKPVDGLSYSLPKTAVRMQVLVEKTVTQPGQLAGFSQLYFGKAGVSTRQTAYRIVGVSFSSEGRADADRQYTVAIDKKHSILSVDCAPDGSLLAINTKAQRAKAPAAFVPSPRKAPLNPRDYMSQDILSAGNLPKMAQLVAQEIYDIRDSRSQLSRGEADFMPKDGEQLRLMYSQLATQEAALMQLFQGKTTVDTTATVLSFVPTKENLRPVVFRFSKSFGLCAADDYSGDPVYANIEDTGASKPLPETPAEVAKMKDGFNLGVARPGHIRITLATAEGKPLGYYETDAAQFGTVEMLNGALFGKKFTSHIILDPATGGVVELKTEPLD